MQGKAYEMEGQDQKQFQCFVRSHFQYLIFPLSSRVVADRSPCLSLCCRMQELPPPPVRRAYLSSLGVLRFSIESLQRFVQKAISQKMPFVQDVLPERNSSEVVPLRISWHSNVTKSFFRWLFLCQTFSSLTS